MPGKFIVIEGTDGSGKGTQFKLLVEKLRQEGFDVETADFPQYGKKSAGLVEEYLNGTYGSADEVGPELASVFFAVDRYDASFQIRKWLEQGKIVISNRYEASNRAFQGQKIADKEKRKKFFDWVTNLEYNTFNIPRADVTILLHVPAEIGQKLVAKKAKRTYTEKTHDIHEVDTELLKRTEQVYLSLAEEDGWIKLSCTKDGTLLSIEEIHEQVYKKIKEFLGEDYSSSSSKN